MGDPPVRSVAVFDHCHGAADASVAPTGRPLQRGQHEGSTATMASAIDLAVAAAAYLFASDATTSWYGIGRVPLVSVGGPIR